MILQPVLTMFLANTLGQPLIVQEILFLKASMPSGAIAAVLANRYGCDGHLASSLVIGTYIISLVTLPLMLIILNPAI